MDEFEGQTVFVSVVNADLPSAFGVGRSRQGVYVVYLTCDYGYSKESSGVRSRRRGAVAAAVQRRVRGQPHAARARAAASG